MWTGVHKIDAGHQQDDQKNNPCDQTQLPSNCHRKPSFHIVVGNVKSPTSLSICLAFQRTLQCVILKNRLENKDETIERQRRSGNETSVSRDRRRSSFSSPPPKYLHALRLPPAALPKIPKTIRRQELIGIIIVCKMFSKHPRSPECVPQWIGKGRRKGPPSSIHEERQEPTKKPAATLRAVRAGSARSLSRSF